MENIKKNMNKCEITAEKVKIFLSSLIFNGVEPNYITNNLFFIDKLTVYVDNKRHTFFENKFPYGNEVNLELRNIIKIEEVKNNCNDDTFIFININEELFFDNELETFGNLYIKFHNLQY